MTVQKSTKRHGITLAHGSFEVRETVHACKAGCCHPSGVGVIRRAQFLAACIPPGGVVGYDVMVRVGLERFMHHRQREEICSTLQDEHGITLSSGEISTLAARFLNYLERLHEARSETLREALQADGGWPLHVDATGEDGRGTLLVAFAGWRRWVLGAWKIPTERADAILPHLREVLRRFGTPCAVIRDLGRAMIPAVQQLVSEQKLRIPVLSCHQHFLRDIGTDLLDAAHGELRKQFRRSKLRPQLRALARDLGRKLGTNMDQARQALQSWQQQRDGHCLPEGRDGLAVVRGLCQWVLDFQADATYGSFPFDRPYLDLHDRCCRGRRAINAYLRHPPQDHQVHRVLQRFGRVLDSIVDDRPAASAAGTVRARAALFDELRQTLRLLPPSTDHELLAQAPLSSKQAVAELRNIRTELNRWVKGLRNRRPQRGPAQDTRQAIDLILKHIKQHGKSLWGHAIALPRGAGGGVRLVDRTNNIQENFFRSMKHGERRRSGRKILTQDFESLPPAAALAYNLRQADYLAILCGSIDELPAAFAQLDAAARIAVHSGDPTPRSTQTTPPTIVISASLPSVDRRLVRSDAMNSRIDRAARSRAPRKAG